MERLKLWFIRAATGERGQDMVEYALITTLLSVVIVLAVLGTGLLSSFETWATTLCNQISEGTC